MMDFDKVYEIAEEFNRENVEYILVGGAAVNLHGLVRVTEDVDFFIRPTPENVERAKRALRRVWDDPAIDEIDAEDVCSEFPTVRYGPPDVDYYVDLMTGI